MARGFNASSTSLKRLVAKLGSDHIWSPRPATALLFVSFRATGWECSDSSDLGSIRECDIIYDPQALAKPVIVYSLYSIHPSTWHPTSGVHRFTAAPPGPLHGSLSGQWVSERAVRERAQPQLPKLGHPAHPR